MKTLTAYDVLNIEGVLYYVCNEFNALVRCENMKQNSLISYLPEESLSARSLVSQILYIDKRILLVPLNAKKIWIFDLEQNKWKGIEIENSECTYKFMKAVKFENKIYLLPSKYSRLVVFDSLTEKVDYLDIGRELNIRADETYFRDDIVISSNIVYAACCSRGYVFKFDMITEQYEWVEISAESEGLSGIAYDHDKFWLVARNDSSKLYCWNGNDFCKKVDIEDKKVGLSKGIFADEKKIYIKKEKETIVLEVQNPQKIVKNTVPYVFFKKQQGGYEELKLDSSYTCHDKTETRSIKLQVEDVEINSFVDERIREGVFCQDNELICENKFLGISDFLKFVSLNI